MSSTEPVLERAAERRAMVDEQLRERGIRDERVLEAMLRVPRHAFVPPAMRDAAYEDRALSIGEGQTISQPYMVARACELTGLTAGQRALEIGAGSGYQAAILASLCAQVVSIELIETLAARARHNLETVGVHNARIVVGDGTLGYAEQAPYDVIVVAAGSPSVPAALAAQLASDGRLIIPLGSDSLQMLTVLRKSASGELVRTDYDACVYVPLRGAGGWADD